MEESEIPQKMPFDSPYTEDDSVREELGLRDAFSRLLPEPQFRSLLCSHTVPEGALNRVAQRLLEEWRQIPSQSQIRSTFDAVSSTNAMSASTVSVDESLLNNEWLNPDERLTNAIEPSGSLEPLVLSNASNTFTTRSSRKVHWGRRCFLAGLGAAAFGGVVWWRQLRQPPQIATRTLSPEWLMMTGVSLFDAAVANRTWGTGALVQESDQAVLSERSLWPREGFGPFLVVRQREESGFLGRTATAYDIRHYAALMGTLFAITEASLWNTGTGNGTDENETRFQVGGLDSRIPEQAMHPTAGRCASAWQETNRLFVLVVAGQPEDYRRFLMPPMTGTLG